MALNSVLVHNTTDISVIFGSFRDTDISVFCQPPKTVSLCEMRLYLCEWACWKTAKHNMLLFIKVGNSLIRNLFCESHYL